MDKRFSDQHGQNFQINLLPLVIFVVLAIFLMSASLATAITIYGARFRSADQWQRMAPLVEAFKQTAGVSAGAIIGLLGGKSLGRWEGESKHRKIDDSPD